MSSNSSNSDNSRSLPSHSSRLCPRATADSRCHSRSLASHSSRPCPRAMAAIVATCHSSQSSSQCSMLKARRWALVATEATTPFSLACSPQACSQVHNPVCNQACSTCSNRVDTHHSMVRCKASSQRNSLTGSSHMDSSHTGNNQATVSPGTVSQVLRIPTAGNEPAAISNRVLCLLR